MNLPINIEELTEKGVTMFQFINYAQSQIILNDLGGQTFLPAKSHAGSRQVKQYFDEAVINPQQSSRTMELLRTLEKDLRQVTTAPKNFLFNEFMAQRYTHPLEVGIELHKDAKQYEHVIAIVVLKPGGNFYTYDDDEGSNAEIVKATVGSCILMQGYKYGKKDMRPYHAVRDIYQSRFTIGCRFDVSLLQ